MTMKTLRWFEPDGVVRLVDGDVPSVQDSPNGVLIKVAFAGVCGTDLHIMKKEFSAADGCTLGHEFSGTVVAIGSAVTMVKLGDKVAVNPNSCCGSCLFCKRGQPHYCPLGGHRSAIGTFKNGGWAGHCLVPEKLVSVLPERLPLDIGVLCEPYSCVVRGYENLGYIADDSQILIMGAGVIGLMWAAMLHHYGFRDVTISEPNAERRAVAEGMSLEYNVTEPAQVTTKFQKLCSDMDGFDIIIDCTGSPRAIETAFPFLRRGGKFMVFGCCPNVSEMKINPADIMLKELTIIGSLINPYTFPRAVQLVSNMYPRYLTYKALGIQTYKLSDYEEAFQDLKQGRIPKAVFDLTLI